MFTSLLLTSMRVSDAHCEAVETHDLVVAEVERCELRQRTQRLRQGAQRIVRRRELLQAERAVQVERQQPIIRHLQRVHALDGEAQAAQLIL